MEKTITPVEGLEGVYTDGRTLYTVNGAPGRSVYGERLVRFEGVEYRSWNPTRSKLAALILQGARRLHIDRSTKVLYLGAASGTTASHVSDIVVDGYVFCVELSERSFRDLLAVCESRKNMIPILADASMPHEYAHVVEGVELVYQDIAQRNQVDVFVRNMASFEAEHGILMLKARSVDVNRPPQKVFSEVKRELVSRHLKVKEVVDINRFAKDHAAFIVEA